MGGKGGGGGGSGGKSGGGGGGKGRSKGGDGGEKGGGGSTKGGAGDSGESRVGSGSMKAAGGNGSSKKILSIYWLTYNSSCTQNIAWTIVNKEVIMLRKWCESDLQRVVCLKRRCVRIMIMSLSVSLSNDDDWIDFCFDVILDCVSETMN
nr:hypothetical protein [Tanacetum cinerariifolium]